MVWVPPGYELAAEPAASQPQPKGSHLWDYIWLVWRGRWLVLLSFILCISIAGLRVYRATPVYQASAKLLLGGRPPRIVNLGNSDAGDRAALGGTSEQINTQIQVLQSKTLARTVIEDLHLYAQGKRDAAPQEHLAPAGWADQLLVRVAPLWERVTSLWGPARAQGQSDGTKKEGEATSDAETEMAGHVAAFLSRLSVANTFNTEVVEVSFRDTNPARCAKVANAVCDTYVKMDHENYANSYVDAGKWIEQKLAEVKANLEKSDQALYEFAGDQDAIALADGAARFTANLEATRESLHQVEQELHERQFELDTLKNGVPGAIVKDTPTTAAPSTGTDPAGVKAATALESARNELRKCETDYAVAKEKFGPGMNEVKALKATKEALEAQIASLQEEETKQVQAKTDDVTKRVMAQTQYAYDQTLSKRDYLKADLANLTERQLTIQQRLVKYDILKREVDVNRELYNNLLQRSREVGLTSGLTASSVSILERADAPLAPVFPNKGKTMLVSTVLGLFLGVSLVFFRDYMDTTVRGAQDVERIGGMTTLGFLPHVESRASKKRGHLLPAMLAADEPRSDFAEGVRQVRAALQYSLAGHSPKTILVTSALPSEGKTTVAANLAIALAQDGRRTVLVDTNLKHPSIHKLFAIKDDSGLSDILAGKVVGALGSQFQPITGNLYVLPSGPRPQNPADLLDSSAMRRLLTTLETYFDHIVLDSSPTLDQVDMGSLIRDVDGVVLVVKPGKTPRSTLVRERERVESLGGCLLGVVLNDRKGRSSKRYGGYHPSQSYARRREEDFDRRYTEMEPETEGTEANVLVLPSPRA